MASHDARRPAVFFDRDGTLVVEHGYAASPDDIELLPGAAAAIRRLNQAGVAAVVITNQSGIARGYFTQADVDAQHDRLTALLADQGASLDAIYVCPHHPDDHCACRKPATGLLERAADELGIDLARSWVIGDRPLDVECGRRGAAGGMLVLTGYGRESLARSGAELAGAPVTADVGAAVALALRLIADGERRR